MPNFNYKAVDELGKISTGQLDDINEIDLELRLERTGLTLISFRLADKQHQFFNSKVFNSSICARREINASIS